MRPLVVLYGKRVQVVLARETEQLMALVPAPGGARSVQLLGPEDCGAQLCECAVTSLGKGLSLSVDRARIEQLGDNQFVA